MSDSGAAFRLRVIRGMPGEKGGEWFVDLERQPRKYGRWTRLNRAQGKTMSEALGALQYGVKQQEKQHPELWTR